MTTDSVDPGFAPVPDTGGRTLEELVGAVADEDRHAFRLLYGQLAPVILGVVTAVVRDGAQSEKLVLDVFIEVWRTACRYRSDRDGTPLTWVVALAHRRAVDQARFARSGQHLPAGDGDHRAASVATEMPAGQHLSRYLCELPEMERDAIVLVYYGAHTYPEIAEMLDTPHDVVVGRIRSGLRHLRRLLDAPGSTARSDGRDRTALA